MVDSGFMVIVVIKALSDTKHEESEDSLILLYRTRAMNALK